MAVAFLPSALRDQWVSCSNIMKECGHCKKLFPTLWKRLKIDDKMTGLCQVCATKLIQKKEKVKEKKAKATQKRRQSFSYLRDQLDKIFSRFIRLRDANKHGVIKCIDCGGTAHWTEVDCGHFVPRGRLSVRWEEKNCAAQLKACNGPFLGRQYEFGKGLDERWGQGTADTMIEAGHQTKKWTSEELEKLIVHYKKEVECLLAQKS